MLKKSNSFQFATRRYSDHGRIIKWTKHISKKRVIIAVLHDGKNDVTSMSPFGC